LKQSTAAGTRSATVACCSNPVANGIDLSLLEHVSPIEWDNIVLYGGISSIESASVSAFRTKRRL
jgi:hypothetical protein